MLTVPSGLLLQPRLPESRLESAQAEVQCCGGGEGSTGCTSQQAKQCESAANAEEEGVGTRTSESTDSDAEEEECPICFDLLVDPLSPCPEQLAHRCCRVCVEKMREHGLPACPLCRAPMQNAEKLFYQAVQLHLRAKRAVGEAKADLQKQCVDMLRRVLEVDPHHTEAMHNLGLTHNTNSLTIDTILTHTLQT